jgi:hypothetical protein
MLGGRLSTGMCDWCKVAMHNKSKTIDPFFITLIFKLTLNLMIPEYSNNNFRLFLKKAGLLLKTPL